MQPIQRYYCTCITQPVQLPGKSLCVPISVIPTTPRFTEELGAPGWYEATEIGPPGDGRDGVMFLKFVGPFGGVGDYVVSSIQCMGTGP